jgi:hypothetical protein
MTHTVTFVYTNHRGITGERTIDVDSIEWHQEPGFGYQPGWFISGRCHEKDARRSFAMSRIMLGHHNEKPPHFYQLLNLAP